MSAYLDRTLAMLSIGMLAMASTAVAQPSIPQSMLAANTPGDVRQLVAHLYSTNPIERADAATQLGNLGQKAVPAIPFLVVIFDDEETVTRKVGSGPIPLESSTWPGEQARFAMVKIGAPAVEPLIGVLTGGTEHTRVVAAQTLGQLKDRRAIGPLIAAARANDDNFVGDSHGHGRTPEYHRPESHRRRSVGSLVEGKPRALDTCDAS